MSPFRYVRMVLWSFIGIGGAPRREQAEVKPVEVLAGLRELTDGELAPYCAKMGLAMNASQEGQGGRCRLPPHRIKSRSAAPRGGSHLQSWTVPPR